MPDPAGAAPDRRPASPTAGARPGQSGSGPSLKTREAWSSPAGFILASIGSAVGIGNIWRFPYMVGTHGGGAFLIPYLLAVVLLGLPLMIAELTLGRHFRRSVVPAFEAIGTSLRGLGLFLVFVLTMILAYYLVVTGWVLAYFVAFAAGAPMSFADFTNSYAPLFFFVLSGGICFLVVRAGVRAGIERLSALLMPVLFVMVSVLAGVALALPGAARGVRFYLAPDFSALGDPLVWTAAFGQAFFSLGAGTGVMLTYGSYLPHGNVVRSAGLITGADLLVALIGGLVVFPTVFAFGFDPAAGVQLAFVTLPRIFQEMRLGLLFGATFFLLLFIAALTSAVSLLELPVATLIDAYGMRRTPATAVTAGTVLLVGFPSALSYTALKVELFGVPLLDLKDFAFGTIGMIVAALVVSVTAGWLAPARIVTADMGARRGVRRLFLMALRWVIPLVLGVTLAARVLERR